MPTITDIQPQRRKGRVSIFVDGSFVMGVGEQVAADLKLATGLPMTEETLRELAGAEEVRRATEAALSLLDVRPRATREVRTRLKQKGYEDDVIEVVVAKLLRLQLLDDSQFARDWVEARSRPGGGRPLGKRRLATELFLKGLSKDEVANAVSVVTPDSELALARAAAHKKIHSVPSDPDALRAEQRRLTSFLQRRGFGWDTVKVVVQEALSLPQEWEDGSDAED